MAYNNHFFFKQLARLVPAVEDADIAEVGLAPVPIPEQLRHDLARQFGSLETLRREMLVTADAMFGPGFVWLVKKARATDFCILPTYLAGTPYTAAHWRRQGLDMNNHGAGPAPGADPDSAGLAHALMNRAQAAAGASNVGLFDHAAGAPGATEVIPLVCVSTWQHVYLRDWGIAGKRNFLEAWWDCIDWTKVEELAYGVAKTK